MPAAAPIQRSANTILNNPGTPDYENAKTAVNEAHTVLEALTMTHLLDELTDDLRREAGGILDPMPVGVGDAFIASLRYALNDNKRTHVTWARHPEDHYDYSVSTDPDGTVQLGLRTPHGDTLGP